MVRRLIVFVALICSASCSAEEFDLSSIERTVRREPKFVSTPRYCLLVFGPAARDRVWLIEDREMIYVDRNGNGDLTEINEAFLPTDNEEFNTIEEGEPAKYVRWKYVIGELQLRSSTHSEFSITRVRIGSKPAIHILSLQVDGKQPQYAHPMFAASAAESSILHFGAPVIPQRLRYKTVSLSAENPELHLRLGTPGQGDGSFVSILDEALPKDVHPVVEITWPTDGKSSTPLRTTATLLHRC
jgi:hypothetical protein